MTTFRLLAALLLATLLFLDRTDGGPAGGHFGWHAAAAQETVRPEVGKPLQAAQEMIKNQRFKEALAKLHDVEAVPNRTPYENLLLDRMRGSAALGAGDADLAQKSFESAFATGKIPEADQARIAASLANVYYRNKDYKACVVWANRALKANPNDPVTRTLMIQALYLSNDFAAAAREALADIQASEKAGQAPAEDRLQLLANCYSHQGNDPNGYAAALERLVTYYPKREYWADLLQRIGEKPSFSPRLQLDLERLKVATKTLDNPAELSEMAELSLSEGLAGEAKRVIDDGFARGVLGKGNDAERQKRLGALAAQRAASAPKDLAAAEATAVADKDAEAMVKVGFGYAEIGQFDKGIALMQQGIAKGGLKHPADAALHLGIVYIQAGQKPKAAQAFRGAAGADGTGDLARLWLKVP
jgi:tetratricopeptide (TPR) repeat protein